MAFLQKKAEYFTANISLFLMDLAMHRATRQYPDPDKKEYLSEVTLFSQFLRKLIAMVLKILKMIILVYEKDEDLNTMFDLLTVLLIAILTG